MPKNNEFVKFDNVDKSYDGKTLVVKGLNLDIEEGEFVTMLGPSGSGKSTIVDLIMGLQKPNKGKVLIDNKDISKVYKSYQKKITPISSV